MTRSMRRGRARARAHVRACGGGGAYPLAPSAMESTRNLFAWNHAASLSLGTRVIDRNGPSGLLLVSTVSSMPGSALLAAVAALALALVSSSAGTLTTAVRSGAAAAAAWRGEPACCADFFLPAVDSVPRRG